VPPFGQQAVLSPGAGKVFSTNLGMTKNNKLTMEETSAIFPAGRSKAESIGQESPHKIYRIVAPGVNRGWIKGFNTGIAPR
jgi:hypothetical protein